MELSICKLEWMCANAPQWRMGLHQQPPHSVFIVVFFFPRKEVQDKLNWRKDLRIISSRNLFFPAMWLFIYCIPLICMILYINFLLKNNKVSSFLCWLTMLVPSYQYRRTFWFESLHGVPGEHVVWLESHGSCKTKKLFRPCLMMASWARDSENLEKQL